MVKIVIKSRDRTEVSVDINVANHQNKEYAKNIA